MKIMIVEDDYVVRQGIIYSLDWEKYGLSICGEADNGEEGLEIAERSSPDIIITDIRMPIMDGIQFSKRIREKYPETKIIILSGYDDFTYAKQAIHIGVHEYLLKPIDADELLKCVCRLRNVLLENRKIEKLRADREEVLENHQTDIHNQLLSQIILPSFQKQEEKILEEFKIWGIELPGPKYKVMLLAVENFLLLTQNHTEEEKKKILELISQIIQQEFAAGCVVECFLNHNNQFVIIMNYNAISKLYEEDCCLRLKQKISIDIGFLCTFACGMEKESLSELYVSYQEAVSALRCHTCQNGDAILRFEENSMQIKGLFLETKSEENELVESLQKYDAKKMTESLNTVFQKALSENEDYQKVKATCIRLALIIIYNLEEMSIPLIGNFQSPVEVVWDIQQYHTLGNLQHYMEQLIKAVSDALKNAEKEKYSAIIRNAVQYVENNYKQEISVKCIAADLYITPNYFSQIFKSQMGINFIDYINEFRVKKAKILLANLKLKVYEVAELAGYQNYKYFNKVFKKHVGCSPKEYRNTVERR